MKDLLCRLVGHRMRILRQRSKFLWMVGYRCSRCGHTKCWFLPRNLSQQQHLVLLAAIDQLDAKHPGMVRKLKIKRVTT